MTTADVLVRALAEAFATIDALRAQLALQPKPDPPEHAKEGLTPPPLDSGASD